MNTKMIRYILCRMLGVESVLLMIPVIVSGIISGNEWYCISDTCGDIIVTVFSGRCKKPEQSHIYGKEGMVIVALAWILWSLFGAMPFTISGFIPNYMDAFF